jgi:HSP20 family protein
MFPLARWDPYDSLSVFDREMSRMMKRFFTDPLASWESPEAWRPALDASREGDDFVLRAELPGIDPDEDLELVVEGNILRIKGQRSEEREINEKDRFLRERLSGSFERTVSLPDGVDVNALHATYDAGVLTVRVPYPAETTTESRRIPIGAGDKPKRVKKPKKVA